MENKTAFLTDLADVLEEPVEKLTDSYSLSDDKWDSLIIVSTIALIDEHFNLVVDSKELQKITSVGELLKLISAQA